MADMSYQEQLAGLAQLDQAGVDALEKVVLAAFTDAEAQDDLDAMGAAADALDQLKARKTSITTAQATEDAEVGTEPVGSPDIATSSSPPADSSAATPTAVAAAAAQLEAEISREVRRQERRAAVVAAARARRSGKLPPALAEHEFGKDKENDDDEDDAVTAAADEDGGDDDDESMTADASAEPANPAEPAEPAESDDTNDDTNDAVTAATEHPKETTVAVEQTDLPADRQPLTASSTSVVLAGADIPQRAAGSEYGNYMEVSESFVSRLNTLRNARGGDGEKLIVASVQSTVDGSRELVPGSDRENYAKVEEVLRTMKSVDREALVASGGYCAPLETRYDIFGVGVADRPVRDSLAGFQATRGGIRYVQPPLLSSFGPSVGLWTAANDANPTSPATKPFMTVACQPEVTVTADAITLELQFGNLMSRAFPELVARNNELGLIYHARFAEQTLLTKISALSTAVSSTFLLGTARDFLNTIGRAAPAYRTRHRLNHNEPLRILVPSWVLDAMREDLSQAFPGNDIEWADGLINAAIASRNVNVSWYIDDPSFIAVQNAGALNDFPTAIKWYIFAEGTFLFLDGGTLDLGIVRDSTLVNTNDYRMFVESFEGVAKVGIESLAVTTNTHVAGLVAGQNKVGT